MTSNNQSATDHVLALGYSDEEVFLQADLAGLDLFIQRLQSIRENLVAGKCDHEHLMTAFWGDGVLTEKLGSVSDGKKLVHHLKLFGWTDEWARNHELR